MTSTLQIPLFLMESEGSHLNSIEGFSYHKEFISPFWACLTPVLEPGRNSSFARRQAP